ncbi:MAG: hypothetical protein AAGL23_01345 [Pseudomonadota bacterium]
MLVAFGSTDAKQTSMLRSDIRAEIAKESGQMNGGGDFHVPFWSDAKNYVLNGTDLELHTETRVASNKQRKRLYPKLQNGFMDWWNNKKRFSNEKIVPYPTEIKARFNVEGLDATVKIENFLGLLVAGNEKRLIYPYFSEEPSLSEQNARLGLWLILKAFPNHPIDDFRILDVLRGMSYSPKDCQWQGNEEATFGLLYSKLLNRWEELKAEY